MNDTLVKQNSSFLEDIDYKFFINTNADTRSRTQNKKNLYFTYGGLIKYLYCPYHHKHINLEYHHFIYIKWLYLLFTVKLLSFVYHWMINHRPMFQIIYQVINQILLI